MTIKHAPRGTADLKALVASDPDLVQALMLMLAPWATRSVVHGAFRQRA